MYQLFTLYKILIRTVNTLIFFSLYFYFCIYILPQLVLSFMQKDVAGEDEEKGKGNEKKKKKRSN